MERPRKEDIEEFCEDGDPNYVLVEVKCSRCGRVANAQANLDWVGALWDGEWLDEMEFF